MSKTKNTKPSAKRADRAKPAKQATAKGAAASASTTKPNKPLSGLDAAAKVLASAGKPMRCQEMVDAMRDRGLWKTDGKTPAATIYSAIIREIADKTSPSRFRKEARGLFALNTNA